MLTDRCVTVTALITPRPDAPFVAVAVTQQQQRMIVLSRHATGGPCLGGEW